MQVRSLGQAIKVLVVALALVTGAPWALSGEDAGSSVADWDGDGKVSDSEQSRYDWIADQVELDDRGLVARRNDAQEGRGDDIELPSDARYLPPEEWRTQVKGKGANRTFEPLGRANDRIIFGDRKGPLPVELWVTADGFDRHVFTAEIRIQTNDKDDATDDAYLIDVYDPQREHGNPGRAKGETKPIREDFNNCTMSGETVYPEGKKRPESAFGSDYQVIAGENVHNGGAAVVFTVGSHAQSAFALTVSRTPQGELRGQLWISRTFTNEQQQLSDEVKAAKDIVRAALAAETGNK